MELPLGVTLFLYVIVLSGAKDHIAGLTWQHNPVEDIMSASDD